ncbi:SDR family oxidoreductase [Rhizobium sp. C1]|uniref:SDR family oxidoreductase n=1 Tax=Rhizobium sp. C1 TaxID=1349799 RepID=UPI001E38F166|nr:SDR family oxidoreductase [Rhizobium sp. C1]MCD2180201.1 SDR family oxidoreductase [Rhizobium sp. C1]
MTLTIFGCGYSGKAIAEACSDLLGPVAGTTRTPDKAERLKAKGVDAYLYAGGEPDEAFCARLSQTTHLVQSIAPGPEGDPLLHWGAARLSSLMPKLEWVGYLSTVGVYGDHDGAWVDEETECRPVSRRSVERTEAEAGWQAFAAASGLPVAVLRLSGIYGPGRNAFVNLKEGTAKRIVKAHQVFNRIRVEDIGAATRFLAERQLGGIYNVTDDEPAPPQDVVAFAAQLMGVEPPPETDFATAELSPMARSFYGENKRVSNAKIRRLGFGFGHPNYRSSLENLWNCGNWLP